MWPTVNPVERGWNRLLNEIARATQKTETTLATFATSRPAAKTAVTPTPAAKGDDQPSLALGTIAEDITPPISKPDLIRALNFPDTDTDEVGFAALRRALKDRTAKQLIQASQDVLTLTSQDGIYMDDLRPDRVRPDIWRRFAYGERGKAVAALFAQIRSDARRVRSPSQRRRYCSIGRNPHQPRVYVAGSSGRNV